MAWSMAKFQWHGAWHSEHKSHTWLGQWPMFNGMEPGTLNTRAVHMATGLVREVVRCKNWQLRSPNFLQGGLHSRSDHQWKACHLGSRRKLPPPGPTWPEVLKLEFTFKLKIKCNDWLLADTCPQAANHCALF